MMRNIRRAAGFLLAVFVWISCAVMPAAAVDFDAEKAFGSVVVVYSGNRMGSGFAIGRDCIVTNAHVLSPGRNTTVLSYSNARYDTEVYAIDEYNDVAILKVPGADFAPLPVGGAEAFRVGDDVYAIGAPHNLPYTLTKGIVSTRERVIDGRSYIQIDAAINQGNSGGPLLTGAGEVIGINSMVLENSQGIGWAIPMATAYRVMEANGVYLNGDGLLEQGAPEAAEPKEPSAPTEDGNGEPVTPPAESSGDPVPAPSQPIVPAEHTDITGILIAILCITAAAAGCVTVAIYRQNRKKAVRPDASDRTDFDIELLE